MTCCCEVHASRVRQFIFLVANDFRRNKNDVLTKKLVGFYVYTESSCWRPRTDCWTLLNALWSLVANILITHWKLAKWQNWPQTESSSFRSPSIVPLVITASSTTFTLHALDICNQIIGSKLKISLASPCAACRCLSDASHSNSETVNWLLLARFTVYPLLWFHHWSLESMSVRSDGSQSYSFSKTCSPPADHSHLQW